MTEIIAGTIGIIIGCFSYWLYATLLRHYHRLKTEVFFKEKQLQSLNDRIDKKLREIDDYNEYFEWKIGLRK